MSGHVRDLLSAYVDGELSPPERGMVEAHLAACEECSAEIEEFAALDGALRALPLGEPDGYFDTFTQRVRERVRAERVPVARRRLPAWTWAAAAALLLAVLTPLSLRRAPTPAALTRSEPETPAADALQHAERDGGAPRPARARSAPPPAAARPKAAPSAPSESFAPPPPASEDAADGVALAAPQSVGVADDELRESAAQAGAPGKAERNDAPRPAAPAPAPAAQPAAALRDDARARASEAPRDADVWGDGLGVEGKGRAAVPEGALGGAGTRGPARKQAAATEDEIALLRARGRSAALTPEELRALRDDWRGFAARNPTGARGDEARLQVIELGYRAFRASDDARDGEVFMRDARTYLERGDGLHDERVRALLADAERE